MDPGEARSFDALPGVVTTAIGDIHRIGLLTIYDIAQRIGAFLRLAPERVYCTVTRATAAVHSAWVLARRPWTWTSLPASFAGCRPRRSKTASVKTLLPMLLSYRLHLRTNPTHQ